MNSDIRTIDLNNLDINNLDLPKDKFTCYILCNNTVANIDLLERIIQAEVKDINSCGRYALLWEESADDICVKYKNNNQKPKCWCVTTENTKLDNFIYDLAFEHCEYYDDEVLSHDPILLFYDDENLKNFVIKRVEWLLEDATTPDPHENDNNYDYNLDFKSRERIELSAHTNKTKRLGICDAKTMIWAADIKNRQGGIAITDEYSTQSLIEAFKEGKRKKNFKILYGTNVSTEYLNNVNLICKNTKGKRVINEYLTHSFLKENKEFTYIENGIPFLTSERQKIIDDNRDDLLVGISFHSNTTEAALKKEPWINEIHEDIADCDYIEVAPIGAYKLYYLDKSDEEIKDAIKLLIKVAKEEDKPVVAVSSPYYANDNQYLEFSILWENEYHSKLPDDYDGHLYSTEEMRYAFDWLNDDDLVEEIVVTNTHKIANMCEDFEYIDDKFHVPYIEDAYNKLEKLAYDKAHKIYGDSLDKSIEHRLSKELENIKNNDSASIYMLHYYINEEAKKEGYINGTRGSIGATLIGFLLGLTKCNPIPPHSVCPKCHKVIWNTTVVDGFDAKPKTCSECGLLMKSDGHNIPYETFMGINGDKLPDIDINLAPKFKEKIIDVIKKVAPNNNVYRVGTINTIWHKDAVKMVNEFAGEVDEALDYDIKEQMIKTIQNVAQGQGVHPGGFIIVPNSVDINDYTPLLDVGGVICAHNDYHTLSNSFYKADFLNHTDQECFKFFKNNGLDFNEINILDPKVIELFNPDNELGYGCAGIPEFGCDVPIIANEIINKIGPKKFSDLVKISTLMHGTNTWKNNGELLFEKGIAIEDLLGSRDDIFNSLVKYGIDRNIAYEITESIRKGRGLSANQKLKICSYVPKWFIDSCNKIKHLFPKAHSIDYVINGLIFAWVKIYKPALFYASYFNFRTNTYELDTMCKSFDEVDDRIQKLIKNGKDDGELVHTLYIAGEMVRRGIKLVNRNTDDANTKITFEINPENDSEIIASSPTI